jgi:catechol 2,3-dioxygenase
MEPYTIDPLVRVGHVHLRVTDLERSIAFYRDVLGFQVTLDGRPIGLPLVTLAAGDYHHHIALNTWHSAGSAPMPEGYAGLHHVAFLYPHRAALGRAVTQVLDAGYPIDVAQDHGATLSVYFRDPDGNGVELTWDRPRAEWFDASGAPVVKAEPFDPRALVEDALAVA